MREAQRAGGSATAWAQWGIASTAPPDGRDSLASSNESFPAEAMGGIIVLEVVDQVGGGACRNDLRISPITRVEIDGHRQTGPILDRGHLILHALALTGTVPLELITAGPRITIIGDRGGEVGQRPALSMQQAIHQ